MGSRRAHSTRRPTAPVPKLSPRPKPPPQSPPPSRGTPDPLRVQLLEIALRLEVLYSTCVTVELALQQQDGDRDGDIACCLMRNVTEPLHDQMEALHGIVKGLERPGQEVQP